MTDPTVAPPVAASSPLALASAARTAQLAVRAGLLQDVLKLWPLLNRKAVDETFPGWLQAMKLAVTSYHAQSAVAAGRFYQAARTLSTGETTPSRVVKLAPAPDSEWMDKAFGYSGPGMFSKDTARPNTALSTTLGTASRIAMDGSRTTILNSVHADSEAVGWYRLTDGHPCAFCALLASRGIVYKDEKHADFQAHNDCGCIGVPAFSHDQELPELNKTALEVYRNRGKGQALPAFRKAWDEHQAAGSSGGGGGSKPPEPPTPSDAGGGSGDGRDVAARLDTSYQSWADALPAEQRAALVKWQGFDRYYQRVQEVLRSGNGTEESFRIARDVGAAIRSGSTPFDLTSWRGVRSATNTFGVDASELPSLVGTRISMPGFLGTSISEDVAREQFLKPPGPGGSVLIQLEVAEGTHAAWVPLAGDPKYREQFELLIGDRRSLLIKKVTYSGGLATVQAEVISDVVR